MLVYFLVMSLFSQYLASTNIDVRFEMLERKLLQRISNLEGIVDGQKNEISNLKQEVATLRSRLNTNIAETNELEKVIHEIKNTSTKCENQLSPSRLIKEKNEHEITNTRKVETQIRADRRQQNVQADVGSPIAFYAYMSANEPLQKNKNLVFDVIKSNYGNGYNKYTGAFIAPVSGVYVLTFTVHPNSHSEASVEVLVNADVKGVVYSDGVTGGYHDLIASTAVVVVWMNMGDVSLVRTSPSYSYGSLYSTNLGRCSFAGWKI